MGGAGAGKQKPRLSTTTWDEARPFWGYEISYDLPTEFCWTASQLVFCLPPPRPRLSVLNILTSDFWLLTCVFPRDRTPWPAYNVVVPQQTNQELRHDANQGCDSQP